MIENTARKPIYDNRVNEILRALVEKTRETAATELGYASYKSLDMYMRRKNFIWDSRKGNYIPAAARIDKYNTDMNAIPVKAAMVISIFNDGVTDPKAAARHAGFIDQREMADYMKRKGYIWSDKDMNYVKTNFMNDNNITSDTSKAGQQPKYCEASNIVSDKGINMHPALEQYLPLLEALDKNKERLMRLLIPDSTTGIIPKYAVPGVPRTKSIYMSDMLCRLIREFSEEKNLSIREVVEAAVIEYLRRYGFENEVETLLKRSYL